VLPACTMVKLSDEHARDKTSCLQHIDMGALARAVVNLFQARLGWLELSQVGVTPVPLYCSASAKLHCVV
jgi:hypothetical protein